MNKLIPISSRDDIPPEYINTPIGLLLEYHNLLRPHVSYPKAELLVGMCMDFRKYLKIPANFSYIIRTGGGNLQFSEFNVSYAIAVGQVRHIALIGHNKCGMVNLISKKEQFVNGLSEGAGWDKEEAEIHFSRFAPKFEIGNETDFVLSETKRLRLRYPKIKIAPMLYLVEDNKLYLLKED